MILKSGLVGWLVRLYTTYIFFRFADQTAYLYISSRRPPPCCHLKYAWRSSSADRRPFAVRAWPDTAASTTASPPCSRWGSTVCGRAATASLGRRCARDCAAAWWSPRTGRRRGRCRWWSGEWRRPRWPFRRSAGRRRDWLVDGGGERWVLGYGWMWLLYV